MNCNRNRFIPQIVVALVGTMVAGCTVGPDYRTPRTSAPVMWASPTTAPLHTPTTMPATTQASVLDPGYATAHDPEAIKRQDEQLARWWGSFNDPMLSSLIDRAMQSNLDLAVATARIRQARATRSIATSGLFPSASVNGSYTRSGTGNGTERSAEVQNGSTITRNVSTGRDLYQTGLDASWELDVFGGLRREVEASEADLQATIEDRRDVLVTLLSEVAVDYMDLRASQRELVIAEANLKSQQYSSDLTRKKFKGGFVAGLDVANADAQVASTQSQIPAFLQSERQSIYALAVLIGQEPGTLIAELSRSGTIPSVPAVVPIGLPSDLLKRRPDVRRADATLHAATARIGSAEADFFPHFSLTGSLTTQAPKLSGLPNWNNSFYSIGPSISWPIFDAGRISANVELQKAVQEEQLANYRKTILVAFQDVENAMVAYVQEQQRHAALNESVSANRRAVDISTRLYAQGQTDFLNVLNAQRSLLGSEDALVQSDRAIATNLIALYKALGGGWDPTQPPPVTQPSVSPLTIGP